MLSPRVRAGESRSLSAWPCPPHTGPRQAEQRGLVLARWWRAGRQAGWARAGHTRRFYVAALEVCLSLSFLVKLFENIPRAAESGGKKCCSHLGQDCQGEGVAPCSEGPEAALVGEQSRQTPGAGEHPPRGSSSQVLPGCALDCRVTCCQLPVPGGVGEVPLPAPPPEPCLVLAFAQGAPLSGLHSSSSHQAWCQSPPPGCLWSPLWAALGRPSLLPSCVTPHPPIRGLAEPPPAATQPPGLSGVLCLTLHPGAQKELPQAWNVALRQVTQSQSQMPPPQPSIRPLVRGTGILSSCHSRGN